MGIKTKEKEMKTEKAGKNRIKDSKRHSATNIQKRKGEHTKTKW